MHFISNFRNNVALKQLRAYLFFIIIILSITIITVHYKWREIGKLTQNASILKPPQKPNEAMDTTILILILSTVGILSGVLFNPKLSKLELKFEKYADDVNKKIDEYQKSNIAQHIAIQGSIQLILAEKDLKKSLGETVEEVLEICSGELSDFISEEGTLFVDFALHVANSSLNYTSVPFIKAKARELTINSNEAAMKLGKPFEKAHTINQKECVAKLTAEIEVILKDELFNSKHKRFRMACEQFLHAHLTASVRSYMEINKKG